ncbi:hypothetical protein [Ruegeria sp. HKCCD8929]|uniref:hypothetical protein n=1 Tax=Ruegeria sp. HKCCD8929 TaxID=2683006 RepID=UPI001489E6A1|nr:hypothetical protein [Ruegeria sp. HKCCD8929]
MVGIVNGPIDPDAIARNFLEVALHINLEKQMAEELLRLQPNGYDFSNLRTSAMEYARDMVLEMTDGNENAPALTEYIFERIQDIFDALEEHVK